MRSQNERLSAAKVRTGIAYDQLIAARVTSGDDRVFALQFAAAEIAAAATIVAELLREVKPKVLVAPSLMLSMEPHPEISGGKVIKLEPRS